MLRVGGCADSERLDDEAFVKQVAQVPQEGLNRGALQSQLLFKTAAELRSLKTSMILAAMYNQYWGMLAGTTGMVQRCCQERSALVEPISGCPHAFLNILGSQQLSVARLDVASAGQAIIEGEDLLAYAHHPDNTPIGIMHRQVELLFFAVCRCMGHPSIDV